MEEIKERKREVREGITDALKLLSDKERMEKTRKIEDRLFDFANFIEAKVSLLYINAENEVDTRGILRRCFFQKKITVLPLFDKEKRKIGLMKADNLDKDLRPGVRGVPEPDPEKCQTVPIERVDIAIIPGFAFDEKGARLGSGQGYYDRLIPKLPVTTRKVALAMEEQIIPQVPMQSHDKHVDIVITDKRIIYKI